MTLSDHYKPAKNEITFRAFLPARTDDELSISRTEAMTEDDVWAMGDDVVARFAGRTIFARGDFHLPAVRERRVNVWQLRVEPAEPPPRHAVIVGWPPPEEAEIRKRFAVELRALATPFGRP